jgi:hypothetical protein
LLSLCCLRRNLTELVGVEATQQHGGVPFRTRAEWDKLAVECRGARWRGRHRDRVSPPCRGARAASGIQLERVLTDYGTPYVSIAHSVACMTVALKHFRTQRWARDVAGIGRADRRNGQDELDERPRRNGLLS